MSIDSRIQELGLELPPAPPAGGVYQACLVIDRMCFVSGHGPMKSDGTYITGRIGESLDQQAGYEAARQTGLTILASLKANLGSLDKIGRVVKLFGMVNCTSDFNQHPAVINGCSELFRDIWGDELGVSTRSAVGVGSLPFDLAVEIEGMFELKA